VEVTKAAAAENKRNKKEINTEYYTNKLIVSRFMWFKLQPYNINLIDFNFLPKNLYI
jgi:hypothetical protein